MKAIKQPNYYCLHCPHSGAMHGGPKMLCGGLDAAGDTCDCSPFVADLGRPPMTPQSIVKQRKAKTAERAQRYLIVADDSGHDYFVPVGQEVLFYQWVEATENFEETDLNFDDCRIDGRFTFTDPRNE